MESFCLISESSGSEVEDEGQQSQPQQQQSSSGVEHLQEILKANFSREEEEEQLQVQVQHEQQQPSTQLSQGKKIKICFKELSFYHAARVVRNARFALLFSD